MMGQWAVRSCTWVTRELGETSDNTHFWPLTRPCPKFKFLVSMLGRLTEALVGEAERPVRGEG